MDIEFWKTKKLHELTDAEWEAICMQCGKCCLIKRQRKNVIEFTNRICGDYDRGKKCCSCYNRRLKGHSCAKVNMKLLQTDRNLLPETCAYRLLYEEKPLPLYHPLISNNPNSVFEAGKHVLCYTVYSEKELFKAYDNIAKKAPTWDISRIIAEQTAVSKKFPLVILESYPIPKDGTD